MKSDRRTIFVSLDDGSAGGQIDLTCVDATHDQAAHPLCHTFVLLARGTLSRCGKSATIVGTRAWNLTDIADAHQHGGTSAVRHLFADEPAPDTTGSGGQADPAAAQRGDAPSRPARAGAGADGLFHASPVLQAELCLMRQQRIERQDGGLPGG